MKTTGESCMRGRGLSVDHDLSHCSRSPHAAPQSFGISHLATALQLDCRLSIYHSLTWTTAPRTHSTRKTTVNQFLESLHHGTLGTISNPTYRFLALRSDISLLAIGSLLPCPSGGRKRLFLYSVRKHPFINQFSPPKR